MDELNALEDWLAPLLASLTPARRRELARDIARDLRRGQQQRIAAQRNPDGSAFEPRKTQLRERAGQIRRRAMFSKIRLAKHLRSHASAEEASVGFTGRVARIAAIHQFGLRDRVQPSGAEIQYPERQLLGLSQVVVLRTKKLLLDFLTESNGT